ncbi:MAG: hypothetical protein R3175_14340 [Marinobacter sp.]|uniref:P-loop ATPase, Sll1717 family n=1 Tax=Marinobacter sp. TaxID=50741 RepID=UPI00299E8B75|nr:hypothetical protein [Marinobacter sp.]MDX1757232.1 hypothetical protein [Marinobacter sp.]
MDKYKLLQNLSFGERIAELEGNILYKYFVQTENWRKLSSGRTDVVYGPKGSGKSALYFLLSTNDGELFDDNIILAPCVNVQGAPIFKELSNDPPVDEQELIGLWKLYFLVVISERFEDFGFRGKCALKLRKALESSDLVKDTGSLSGKLNRAYGYIKKFFRPESAEGTVHLDPVTQLPVGLTGKISFSEPSNIAQKEGIIGIDELLLCANQELDGQGFSVWLLLDRLDVAFSEDVEMERVALRALFRVYLDMAAYSHIKAKIFLRDDIWNRIVDGGFREASHITKNVRISWNRASLLNLIIRRLLHNEVFVKEYGVDVEKTLSSVDKQQELFYRVFPQQVEVGPNKSSTLDWILSRTRDGKQLNAPRELIHFLNELVAEQLRKFEIGGGEPPGEQLFVRGVFKDALPEVSVVRLTQTIYAEHDELRPYIEALRESKTAHTVESLGKIWGVDIEKAKDLANRLVDIGFFESRVKKQDYWVPFLYRDALNMIQGSSS